MNEVAAGGVVYRKRNHQTEFLLIDDQYGHISFPKGRKEQNETDEETAIREIEEETGIQGQVEQRLTSVHYSYEHPQRGFIRKESIFFLVEALTDEIIPQWEEIKGASWYTVEEAGRLQADRGYEGQHGVFREACRALFPLIQAIDHTLLKAQATELDYLKLCTEAKIYGFASVCVPPHWVKLAQQELEGTGVKIGTVVGFPWGYHTLATKVKETEEAIAQGADEIDMVINRGAFHSGDHEYVKDEVEAVVQAAKGGIVKVILETGELNKEEIHQACQLVQKAGAHYVKTSTGFVSEGASIESIRFMKEAVGDQLLIKASGGIRDQQKANEMIEAGASRIGSSSGVQMIS